MTRVLQAAWPAIVAAVLFTAATFAPRATEALYARRLYPLIAGAVGLPARGYHTLVGGRFAPSLAECLVVVLAVLAASSALRAWRGAGAPMDDPLAVARLGPRVARLALCALRWSSWLALVFVATWGLNHARRPLLDSLGWRAEAPDSARLEKVARRLAALSAAARASLAEDERGVVLVGAELDARAARAWRVAGERRALLRGPASIVARPLASSLLIAARVSGIFSPFTGESHVARGLPAIARGFVTCHELAHRKGFAREDEANALAFLVGIESEDDELVHSAAANGLLHVLRALREASPGRWTALATELDPGLVRDLADQRDFWARERSAVTRGFGRVATATNDAYLRSMGARDGLASYGRMLDLVVAWSLLTESDGRAR